jgi:hypothetical protein
MNTRKIVCLITLFKLQRITTHSNTGYSIMVLTHHMTIWCHCDLFSEDFLQAQKITCLFHKSSQTTCFVSIAMSSKPSIESELILPIMIWFQHIEASTLDGFRQGIQLRAFEGQDSDSGWVQTMHSIEGFGRTRFQCQNEPQTQYSWRAVECLWGWQWWMHITVAPWHQSVHLKPNYLNKIFKRQKKS